MNKLLTLAAKGGEAQALLRLCSQPNCSELKEPRCYYYFASLHLH